MLQLFSSDFFGACFIYLSKLLEAKANTMPFIKRLAIKISGNVG